MARCGNDSRHDMLSEATLRLQILTARKSVEAACLKMPINSAVSRVALSNSVKLFALELNFAESLLLGVLL